MKSNIKEGLSLPLADSFYSIQGEGFNYGKAVHFIRIAGCDIRCSWCDSKTSWNSENFPTLTIDQIADTIDSRSNRIVITGGEPTLYNLQPLTDKLKAKGYQLFIESTGAYPITGEFNWITISPKESPPPLTENLQKASELKVVIEKSVDFKWAEECRARAPKGVKLFLQPEWYGRGRTVQMVVEYIKENPEWRLSLQSHNYIKIP